MPLPCSFCAIRRPISRRLACTFCDTMKALALVSSLAQREDAGNANYLHWMHLKGKPPAISAPHGHIDLSRVTADSKNRKSFSDGRVLLWGKVIGVMVL